VHQVGFVTRTCIEKRGQQNIILSSTLQQLKCDNLFKIWEVPEQDFTLHFRNVFIKTY
jgi:hypothetical protein